MLVSALFSRINYALRGIDDTTPTEGSEDATYWLDVINRKQDEFALDPMENWSSMFELRDLVGTIVALTQTYDLAADFIRPSDDVYITTTQNQRLNFRLLKPQLRDFISNPVFISGINPQKLTFVDDITAGSTLIGGTITVGGYFKPAALTAFTDTVLIPDPNWLAMAAAAEIAFNDVSYEDKSADLNAKANALYMAMKAANRRSTVTNPRTIPTSVRRIRGVDYV